MKKVNSLFVMLALAVLAFVACEKTPMVESELPKLEVFQSEYNIESTDVVLSVEYTSNTSFSVIAPEWIHVPTSLESPIQFIIDPCEDLVPRTGEIEFIKEGALLNKITVNQAARVIRLRGFYQVNEGTWGVNNASVDYYDFNTSKLTNHWWLSKNSDVRGGLGDVANDVYATIDYLLIVVNSSNILEICDRDGKHLGEVEIPNCRKVTVDGDYAYVTSYAGTDGNGYVSKVSLLEMKEVAQCVVDDQPENLFIYDGSLYVVNTFGYQYPCTTNSSCSVISLETFTETSRNDLGYLNAYGSWKSLGDGTAFVAFSGDYGSNPAKCAIVDLETFNHKKDFDFSGTFSDVVDGKLYIMGTNFSWITFDWDYQNYVYDIALGSFENLPLGEETFMKYGAPTGIWVNPENKDIYIADQGNYTSPAYLYHYDSKGNEIERLDVGVCPGHFAWDWR